jgi:type I restriction enzyme S subunit
MAGDSKTAARNHLADAGVLDLPDGWEVTEVGDILAEERGISVGVMYPGDHCSDGVPLIKAGDLQGSTINPRPSFRISRAKHHEYRRTELLGGELIMTLVGNVGQCAVVPHEMRGWNVARAVAAIRLRDPSDAHYVQQCLLSRPLQHLMEVWCNTTVQATLNLKEIRQLPLPWPPKSCRDAIAHFGKMLDDKIELNRRMNATLESISRALFKSWFVDFDPVRQKAAGKQPVGMDAQTAALFPDSFEDSEIGEVPKGWGVVEVRDFLSLSRDAVDPSEHPAETFDHYSLPAFDSGCWPSPDMGADIKSQKLLVAPGSVLISKLNPRTPRVWIPQARHARRPVASTEFLVAVPNETTGVAVPFVFCFASSESVVEYLASHASGTSNSHQRVRPDDFLNLRTALATNGVLEAFDKVVGTHLERASHARSESRTVAALRDTLLPKLLSGEVRVPEAEGMVEEAVG